MTPSAPPCCTARANSARPAARRRPPCRRRPRRACWGRSAPVRLRPRDASGRVDHRRWSAPDSSSNACARPARSRPSRAGMQWRPGRPTGRASRRSNAPVSSPRCEWPSAAAADAPEAALVVLVSHAVVWVDGRSSFMLGWPKAPTSGRARRPAGRVDGPGSEACGDAADAFAVALRRPRASARRLAANPGGEESSAAGQAARPARMHRVHGQPSALAARRRPAPDDTSGRLPAEQGGARRRSRSRGCHRLARLRRCTRASWPSTTGAPGTVWR
jgi:hypothetical protein